MFARDVDGHIGSRLIERLKEVGRDFRGHRERLTALDADIADMEHERLGLAAMVESGRTAVHNLETEALQIEGELGQLMARESVLQRCPRAAARDLLFPGAT